VVLVSVVHEQLMSTSNVTHLIIHLQTASDMNQQVVILTLLWHKVIVSQ